MNAEISEFINKIKNEALRNKSKLLVEKTNELAGVLSGMYPNASVQYRLVREDEVLFNVTDNRTFGVMFTIWFVGNDYFWKEGELPQHGEKIIG